MKKSTHHAILTQVIMARRYNMESGNVCSFPFYLITVLVLDL